jgi:acyl-CoA synthetase (AMP-forming)/AMP-acid ligase II
MTTEPATLPQALQRAAAYFPPRHLSYVRGHAAESRVSYADLSADASRAAAWLAHQGVARGEPIVLALTDNQHFVRAFWSCLLAGAVPVPLAAPSSWTRPGPGLDRFRNVVRQLGCPAVVVDAPTLADPNLPPDTRARGIVIPSQLPDVPASGLPEAAPDDVALIQFSSGSTGHPKGVVLTHRNVMTNLAAIRAGVGVTPDETAVNWMPLHHDFGLIGLLLGSISCPNDLVQIETAAFIRRPLLWLDVLHTRRAAITACPNFAQALVLSRLERSMPWDLSALRVIFNGAEPISARVMAAFADALAPAGLRPSAMLPVYGLAEATLAVTFSALEVAPRVVGCDRRSLGIGGRVRVADGPQAVPVVSVGTAVQHCAVHVVDDDDRGLEDGRVGHVLVRGGQVMAGYFQDDEATAAAFHDSWLRTGDLGFLREGELFVTGRAKDVLFLNGTNLYAHDLEQSLMQLQEAAGRRIAVCAWRSHEDDADRLLVFVASSRPEQDVPVFRAIEIGLAAAFGLRPHAMVPLMSSQFPRTTSGKLQRHLLRERFDRGEFDEAAGRLARVLEQAGRDVSAVAPRSDTERLVHAIWARELGLSPTTLSIHHRFDAVGGTSLIALAVTQAIEDASGVRLASDTLYQRPTIAMLADHLESRARLRLPVQRARIFRG